MAATYLYQLEIKDYKSFIGNNIFNFATKKEKDSLFFRLPQCTVFLGDNGTGKTNLLKVLANLQPITVAVEDIDNSEKNTKASSVTDLRLSLELVSPNTSQQNDKTIKQCFRPAVYERYQDDKYLAYCRYISYDGIVSNIRKTDFKELGPTIRQNDYIITFPYQIGYSKNNNFVEYDVPQLADIIIYAYGVNRFADTKRNLVSDNTVETLFHHDRPLINLEEWLSQLEMAKRDPEQGKKAQKRINNIKKLLKESKIFPGVTDYRINVDSNLNVSVKFITEQGELSYHDLGYGYQCMMAWIFDFIKKLFDRYPDSDKPLEQPAILIVDEIDLHLHPHWQRHVIRDLCSLFPATQIIVSTHSPLVIQSATSMNLFLLNNKDGKTIVTEYPSKTFQGWSVEEILDELMALGPDTRADEYHNIRANFEHALNSGNVPESIKYYSKLKDMLYPGSTELDLLEMDINLLKSLHND